MLDIGALKNRYLMILMYLQDCLAIWDSSMDTKAEV